MSYPYMKHEGSIYRDSKDSTTKEIIILAMGPTRRLCPFDCEVWGLNNGYRQIMHMRGRLDKLFLSHTQCWYPNDGTPIYDWNEINKLVDVGVDVLNIHKVTGLKSRLYPLKKIAEKFGTWYFANTICYQLAYACYKGINKIRLYGCDMMTMDEYQLERGGVEYWIARFIGMGGDFWISEDSSVCKTHTNKPYGIKYYKIEDIDPLGLLKRHHKVMQKMEEVVANDTEETSVDMQEIIETTKQLGYLENIRKNLTSSTENYEDITLPKEVLTIDEGVKLIRTPNQTSTNIPLAKSDEFTWEQGNIHERKYRK